MSTGKPVLSDEKRLLMLVSRLAPLMLSQITMWRLGTKMNKHVSL
jgi:hypothetical protein